MKTFIPLGPNVILKVPVGEIKIGSIIVASEASREAQARDEGVIECLGEDSFSDLQECNRPKVGDTVIIARYDGKTIDETKDYTRRVIADTRILAVLNDK